MKIHTVVILVLLFGLFNTPTMVNSLTTTIISEPYFITHDSIFINGNADFAEFPGSGTITDPYVIENYEFNKIVELAVYIKNTNVYFTIRNNDMVISEGIKLQNVTHGVIEQNTISNNIYTAVTVIDSSDIIVLNNTISDAYQGILVTNSQKINISTNDITTSKYDGVLLQNSDNICINNNTIKKNQGDGIAILHTKDLMIKQNIITANDQTGIDMYNTSNSIIKHNWIMNNSLKADYYYYYSEVFVQESSNIQLESNEVAFNLDTGIRMENTKNSFVRANYIHDNAVYGLDIHNYNNAIIANTILTSQKGIFVVGSKNYIAGNSIINTQDGIYLAGSSTKDNKIVYNTFRNNSHAGLFIDLIYPYKPTYNNIKFNNFIANSQHVIDEGAKNFFFGNYWENSTYSGDVSPSHTPVVPYASSPENQQFGYGADTQVTWYVGSFSPANYTITYNGGTHTPATEWDTGSIDIVLNKLPVGTHNYTLTLYDTLGNSTKDSVLIHVLDTTVPPSISHPDDLQFIYNSTIANITWSVADETPATYCITLNNSIYVDNSNWSNGTIFLNVTDLEVGTYYFTIYVNDTFGNVVTDEVIVQVLSIPTINSTPVNSTTKASPLYFISGILIVVYKRRIKS